jgi:hypothetical protein
MQQVGQTYRPSGAFDMAATIFASTSGLIVALAAAALIWGWEISGLPTLIIITPFVHGLLIGAVLVRMFRMARLRNPRVALALAVLCAAVSVAAVHYGHYRWLVHDLEKLLTADAQKAKASSPENIARRDQFLAELHRDPDRFVDDFVFEPETGHRGFAGAMLLRAKAGQKINSTHGGGGGGSDGIAITGIGMWILWTLEAAFVIGVAISMTAGIAKEPFCETCGRWFDRSDAQLRMAPAQADTMIAAVRGGDPETVAKLHAAASNPATSIMPRIYTCAGECGQHLADVVVHAAKEKGGYTDTPVTPPTYVSPEIAAALRSPPAKAAATS